MVGGNPLRELACVEPNKTHHVWNSTLRNPDPLCPHRNVVFILPNHRRLIKIRHGKAKQRLDNLLQDDIAADFPPGSVVALKDLGWSVEPVLREKVVLVDDVEKHADGPICNYWKGEGKV